MEIGTLYLIQYLIIYFIILITYPNKKKKYKKNLATKICYVNVSLYQNQYYLYQFCFKLSNDLKVKKVINQT